MRGGGPRAKSALAQAVDAACRDLGFLVVKGHGVDPALIWQLHEAAADFFSLPAHVKRGVAIGTISSFNGYAGYATENLSRTIREEDARGDSVARKRYADLRETYQIGPFDYPEGPYYSCPRGAKYFSPNAWPQEVPTLRPVMSAYFRAMEKAARELLGAFALALDLPETWFEDKIDRHISSVLINHYPGVEGPMPEGQLRSSPHTDFGAATILHLGRNPKGLQVLDHDGVWRDVSAPADAFVVNIGDLLSQWTNDTWTSTMHRVVLPAGPAAARQARQTVTFFVRPNYDTKISCIETRTGPDNPPRYPVVESGEHYDAKIALMRGAAAA
jgi:isopenicillin N synthase-like dioxygenase